MGKPEKIITTDDAAWEWKGDWLNKEGVVEWPNKYKGKVGSGATNGKAALTFSGTFLLILCINSEKGGKADVYVDGRKSGIINAYVPKTPLMMRYGVYTD